MISPRRVLVLGTAGLAALVAFAATADGQDGGKVDVITEARRRAESVAYRGVAVLQWIDADGVHKSLLSVRSSGDDAVEISGADRRAVTAGGVQLLWDGADWSSMSRRDETTQPPAPDEKYDLQVSDGPTVAGRSTKLVEAIGPTHEIEQRIAIDRDTGVVLARDWLDRGEVVRTLRFRMIEEVIGGTVPVTTPATSSSAGAPDVVRGLPEPYTEPAAAGHGYRLLRRLDHGGELVQLEYGDGLSAVSVFEQPGELDWGGLPAGGAETEIDGARARAYTVPLGMAYVWERGGIVYTSVGDAPRSEIVALAADVDDHEQSVVEQVLDTVFGPLSF